MLTLKKLRLIRNISYVVLFLAVVGVCFGATIAVINPVVGDTIFVLGLLLTTIPAWIISWVNSKI